MIRQISIDDAVVYGQSEADIETAILARSHAIWGDAGRPVAPPNPFGRVLLGISQVLIAFFVLAVVSLLAADFLVGEARLKDLAKSTVPSAWVPAGFEAYGFVFGAVVAVAATLALLAWPLQSWGLQMLRLAPQPTARQASSKRNIARRFGLWSLAILIGGLGAVLFIRPFIPIFFEPASDRVMTTKDVVDALIGSAGLGLVLVGIFIGQRAYRLGKPSALELQEADPRPPVLLLRSFHDEGLMIARITQSAKGGTQYAMVRLEEAVADQFAPYGPLVAIGKPGETLPTEGAARNYYSDAEWQEAVAKWMDEAQMIVLIPGLTKGLGWELEAIERHGHISKLVVMMPATVGGWSQLIETVPVVGHAIGGLARLGVIPDSKASVRANLQQRWDIIRVALGDVAPFAGLPERAVEGAMVLHLANDQQPTIIVGPETASEEDYERALALAVYGMFCRAA